MNITIEAVQLGIYVLTQAEHEQNVRKSFDAAIIERSGTFTDAQMDRLNWHDNIIGQLGEVIEFLTQVRDA